MATRVISIPFYRDPDYFYTIALQNVAYTIRFYYNERVERWAMDFSYADGTPIIMGQSLVRNYPMYFDYHIPSLTGYFYVEEIGKSINETEKNTYEIWKYFKMYYIYEEE